MQGSEENFCAGVISTVITWEGRALETLEKSVKYVPVETLEKGAKYVQNSGVFIINFEKSSDLFLVFLLFTMNR